MERAAGEAGWEAREYAGWLEECVKGLVDIDPECIAMEMTDKAGRVFTCYWRVSADDRARFIRAMEDDDRMEWLRENREAVLEILDEDEEVEAEDGL